MTAGKTIFNTKTTVATENVFIKATPHKHQECLYQSNTDRECLYIWQLKTTVRQELVLRKTATRSYSSARRQQGVSPPQAFLTIFHEAYILQTDDCDNLNSKESLWVDLLRLCSNFFSKQVLFLLLSANFGASSLWFLISCNQPPVSLKVVELWGRLVFRISNHPWSAESGATDYYGARQWDGEL